MLSIEKRLLFPSKLTPNDFINYSGRKRKKTRNTIGDIGKFSVKYTHKGLIIPYPFI